MKENIMPIHEKYVNEFYKLFSSMNNEFYVGSREQARLELQLKMQRFIPLSYIDRTFKTFIASNLIVDTGAVKEIEKQIGIRFFKNTAQKMYSKNTYIKNIDEAIQSLYLVFQDFFEKTGELVTKEDVLKLKKIEDSKEISLKSILDFKESRKFKLTEDGFLYDIPRTKMLEFIEELEMYDVEKVETERQSRIIQKRNEELLYIKRIHLLSNKCIDIIQQSIDIDGYVTINSEVNIDYVFNNNCICSALIKNISIEDMVIVINDDCFSSRLDFHILMIDVNNLYIKFKNHFIGIKIFINEKFRDELQILQYSTNQL